ncbi:hypothetical protein DPMN_103578 [Dreissena polymorpha]|uniref:Uncharacterized protein n=1 Tax=Dreissena polymorpha TaxID=45954 RepID=A0A9D4HBB4_DREPO|nr:hypothetical protein DPMN_103578 [Dreissena polymorpha]
MIDIRPYINHKRTSARPQIFQDIKGVSNVLLASKSVLVTEMSRVRTGGPADSRHRKFLQPPDLNI